MSANGSRGWEVQGDYGYGHGWEVLTTEESLADAKATKATYVREEGCARYRIVRERIEVAR